MYRFKVTVWAMILLFVVISLLIVGCAEQPVPQNEPDLESGIAEERQDQINNLEEVDVLEEEERLAKVELEEEEVMKEIKLPPEISILNASPVLGDHVVLEISNLDFLPEVSLQTELEGELARPYWNDDGKIDVIWGISYYNEPGEYEFTLNIAGDDDTVWQKTQKLEVLEGDFTYQQFSVPATRTAGWTTEELQTDREKFFKSREHTAPEPLWCGPFVWPLEGRISSDFGAVRVINEGNPRRHSGIDIVAPTGTPLMAANCGTVTLSEHLLAHGNTVVVDHGLGLFSAYLHMDELDVEAGQTVVKGEVLGTVGETGFVTGAHLHWSIYIGHTPVSPYGFMHNLDH